MLGEQEKATFADRGIVFVPGLIPAQTVAPIREQLYDQLSSLGLWHEDEWIKGKNPEKTRKTIKLFKNNAKSKTFNEFMTTDVMACVNALVNDRPIHALMNRMQLLFTPPNASEWTVPYNIWHLDYPRLGTDEPPGVQVFTFVDKVEAQAGGTLFVAGSHRLLNNDGFISSKGFKHRLKRESYFHELMNKHREHRETFLDEIGECDGVTQQVFELTGEPGDVYFTDPRLLHTLSPNTSQRPRIMATQRFMLEPALEAVNWKGTRNKGIDKREVNL